jgi:hypothetical protein
VGDHPETTDRRAAGGKIASPRVARAWPVDLRRLIPERIPYQNGAISERIDSELMREILLFL